ncbi:MAG: hypothetical protein ACYSW8_30510, partial [Planctomycetota bacterium]
TFVPEININWEENNDVFLPLKASLGRLLSENAVATAGFSVPVVNDFDLYDWQIELTVSLFF